MHRDVKFELDDGTAGGRSDKELVVGGEAVLGVVLKAHRKQRRLTQKELAAMLGVSREHYARIENGVCKPSYRLFEKICSSIDCPSVPSLKGPGKNRRTSDMCSLCSRLLPNDRQEIERLMKLLSER